VRSAVLFVTCLVDQLYPTIGLAAADLLERQGVRVEVVPEATCCGQLAFNAGYRDEARAVAAGWVERLRDQGDIVIPSGSCAAMVRHLFAELFAGSRWEEDAGRLASRTFELTEYLVDVLGASDVGARFDGTLAYHHACHGLRYLGLGSQAAALLGAVAGARLVALPGADECCGFGGLFAVKHADVSAAMLDRKLANVATTGADVLVTADASCLTQMAGGLSRRGSRVRVRHIAEVLANRAEDRRPW
jgi:L-lactate dehydrogenase complex protein LldE